MLNMERLDALCMCREFKTPVSGWQKRINVKECIDIGFHDRWRKVLVEDWTSFDHEIVAPGGLHAIVYESFDQSTVTIAFRHQEGEMLWDNGQLESMGLWGRDFIQQQFQNSGAVVSFFATKLQHVIHYTRRFARLDYFTQSKRLIASIRQRRGMQKIKFTGYSLGGAIAQLAAIFYRSNATLFASVGTQDIIEQLYMDQFESKIPPSSVQFINIFAASNEIPALDCQYGTECRFNSSKGRHEDLVYGTEAMEFLRTAKIHLPNVSVCVNANEYNHQSAVCLATTPQVYYDFQTIVLIGTVLLYQLWKRMGL